MDIIKFRDKLKRYLKGSTNETENALIDAWYKSYEAREKPLSDEQRKQIGEKLRADIQRRLRNPKIYQLPLFKIAACFLLVAGAGWLCLQWMRNKSNPDVTIYTFRTHKGELKQFTLADSSVVWVNASSTIQFPASFPGKLREVKLKEGEAFFEIKHDAQHPFIVHTGKLDVQVLGTSFNIRTYRSLDNINVAVATGRVAVSKGKNRLAMLLPGKAISFDTNTSIFQIDNVNPADIEGWKTGNTYLKQAGFKELALIVQNLFGLSLKAGSDRINNYRFSLHIQHNLPADKVLAIINQIHNTHYKKEGNEVLIY